MRAKRKTVLKGFDYMHCDDFARLLMDMAAKGWHFKEWGVGLKFEKGEREQAVFAAAAHFYSCILEETQVNGRNPFRRRNIYRKQKRWKIAY